MLRVRMSIYETNTDNVLTRADEPLSDDPETADRDIEAAAAFLTRQFKKVREESGEDVIQI